MLLMDGLASGIRWVRFADGSLFTLEGLYARNSLDVVNQSTDLAGAQLLGSAANNQLSASGGGSTFRGGRGDDTLVGAGGGNLYLYERGDGIDHIHDTGGHTLPDGTPAPNRVRFGEGIRAQDLRLAPGAEGTLEVLQCCRRVVVQKGELCPHHSRLEEGAVERQGFVERLEGPQHRAGRVDFRRGRGGLRSGRDRGYRGSRRGGHPLLELDELGTGHGEPVWFSRRLLRY